MISSILVASTIGDNSTRYVLLTLIFVAVLLLFAGVIIAVMTLVSQRKRRAGRE